MEHKVKINPKMLTLARASRGMVVSELAEKLGISTQAAWYYEKHFSEISQPKLTQLAEILRYPPLFFYQEGETLPLPTGFRKRGKVAVKQLTEIEAHITIFRLNLERFFSVVKPDESKLPFLSLDKYGSATACAKKLRELWRIPKGRIDNMAELLENKDIFLMSYDFGSERVDGHCDLAMGKYPMIVTNRKLSGDRQRFTLAYHLGFLVMLAKDEKRITRDVSHECNLFAAEFLLPEKDIVSDLTELNFNQLPDLKKKWKTSMIALLYRANDLNTISDNQCRYILQIFNDKGIRRHEPKELEIPTENYTLVKEMLVKYKNAQRFGISGMAAFLRLEEDEFLERYELKAKKRQT